MAEFLIPDWPAPANVRALVTTRALGNLAGHVGDDPNVVAANRARLRQHLPVAPIWLSQVHGTRCVEARSAMAGTEADALFACGGEAVCAVLTADCLPILLCDEAGTVVAAAHAGWRGLAAGVIEATVAAMSVSRERLLAWMGPAIGPSAFEVGEDVRAAFTIGDPGAAVAFEARSGGKWSCNLYALARRRLNAMGIECVFGGDRCTFTEHEFFFSYRREGRTGRMASLVWIV